MNANPNKKTSRGTQPLQADSNSHAVAYEAPSLVEVGNLRELLGKSGADDDVGQVEPRFVDGA